MQIQRFIRFVVNDKGEGKIKMMQRIQKIYDNKGKFLEIIKPYIRAYPEQIEVDIEITKKNENKSFMPLRHYKHKDGNIILRTQKDIQKIEEQYRKDKEARKQAAQKLQKEIQTQKDILADEDESTENRLNAMSKLIKLKGI